VLPSPLLPPPRLYPAWFQSILALGYDIKRTGAAVGVTWEFGRVPKPPVGLDPDSESLEYDWTPKPFPTDHISVPPEVKKLGELLAENVHDVSCPITWGASRCAISCHVLYKAHCVLLLEWP
jgi:hypothetical protein